MRWMIYGMIRVGGIQMITVLLMIYLGVQPSVPIWYYIICVLMMIIQAIKPGIEIQKNIEKNRIKWIDANPR